eukprot:3666139-Prymnesium_polylepis.1
MGGSVQLLPWGREVRCTKRRADALFWAAGDLPVPSSERCAWIIRVCPQALHGLPRSTSPRSTPVASRCR